MKNKEKENINIETNRNGISNKVGDGITATNRKISPVLLEKTQVKLPEFTPDKWGHSEVSEAIDTGNYGRLKEILNNNKLYTKLNINEENTLDDNAKLLTEIVNNIVNDKILEDLNIDQKAAANIYYSAKEQLNNMGELTEEVILAGNQVLEWNL